MVLSTAQKGHHLTYISKSAADVLRAADDGNPKIKKALAAALKSLQAQVPDLTSLIATGNPALVMDAISKANIPQPLIDRVIDATVTTAIAGGMTDAARFSVAFNDVNDRAIRWATLNAAKDITSGGVGLATQAAIRDVMVNAVEAGVNPRVTAKLIEGMVPLDGHRAGQIKRFTDKAIEDGIDPDHIAKVVARKTARGIKFRAVNIARTESLKAANRGQQFVWDAAKDLGYIPEGTMKVWDATGDSRTCQICMAMDGQPVEVSSEFAVTEFVKKPSAPKTPPAHPQCRCTMVLEHIPAGKPKQPATTGGQTPSTPPPAPRPTPSTSLADVGVKAPRNAAQRELMENTVARLDDLDPVMAARYKELMNDMTDIKLNVATARQKSIAQHGKVTAKLDRDGNITEQKMMLNLSHQSEEYDDWLARRNTALGPNKGSKPAQRAWEVDNPMPDQWRLNTDEEMFDVLVHELGHANINSLRQTGATTAIPKQVTEDYWTMAYGGDPNWKQATIPIKKLDSYVYGLANPAEMQAELHRFYLNGVSEMTAKGRVADVALTAEEWRMQNPTLAAWVEEMFGL
jgi:hypothetical protein